MPRSDRLNVAVYAITKNEAQFVDRWIEPLLGVADSITVLDTGSEDDTVARLAWYQPDGLELHTGTVSPWRFDDARNASLALVPAEADVAIALDLDEVLQPGWRQALEDAWEPGVTRLRYPFVWSWLPDGSPGVTYYADKIHDRHAYRWRNPCHEVLATVKEERQGWTEDLIVHHFPDTSKPRSQYLPLMRMALLENPDDDRMQHYYGRELMYQGRMSEAAVVLKEHLRNPKSVWKHERSETMLHLSRCEPSEAETWLLRAVAECPERKETWYELAKFEQWRGNREMAAGFAQRALDTPPDKFYLSNPEAQGDGPARILAWASSQGDSDG